MIGPVESFAAKLEADTRDAEDAWRRGVLSDRDMAEWVKLNKDFLLMLQRFVAEQQEIAAAGAVAFADAA